MADERPMESTGPPGPDAAIGSAEKTAGPADSLVIDDQDRYSSLRLISWWRQDRLRSASILVVGAALWATR